MAVPIVGDTWYSSAFNKIKGASEHYKDDNNYRSVIQGVIYGVIGIVVLSTGALGQC